jgi:uncharacterized protein YdhG (YjbR/CyaY superfamily)
MTARKARMTSAPAADIDQYLATVPEDARATLEKIRQIVRAAAPKAVEAIWYQIPTFKLDGRALVGFAAFKNHCSFFPMSMAVMRTYHDELNSYDTSKGTIRFPFGKPLRAALVKKIVKARIKENEARAKKKAV